MIFLVLMSLNGFAQEQLRAVFSGGRVYLADEQKFSQIRNGQLLSPTARLELVGNSFVLLMDDAGRLISLSLTGTYELETLDMSLGGDSSAFVKSVWEEYYASNGEDRIEDLLTRNQALESSRPPFELLVPSSSQFYSDRLVMQWSPGNAEYYVVNLINEFGEVFEEFGVEQASVEIDFLQKGLAWKDELTIQVTMPSTGHTTALYTLDRLNPPDYEKLDRLLKEHFKDQGFESLLTKAAFFENQWLFADAITLLFELRKEHEGLMKNFWNQYLIRNGFYSTSRL